MDEIIVKKFLEQIDAIKEQLKKRNLRACRAIVNDFIMLSALFDFSDGIFIGENMHSVFDDFIDLIRDYELKNGEIKEVLDKISDLVKGVREFISESEKDEHKLYRLMKDARVAVTKLQIESARIRKRRFPRLPEDIFEIVSEEE